MAIKIKSDKKYHTSNASLSKAIDQTFIPQEIQSRRYKQHDSSAHAKTGKPNGFWYAYGDSWKDLQKISGASAGKFLYEVIVIPKAKIYKVESEKDLDKLVENFPLDKQPGFVDWNKASKKYDGIDIRRVNQSWIKKYIWSGFWDIPSGSIWNTSVIRIVLIKT